MNLKTFNESFRKYYTEDIDEVVKESFESDLRNSLERVSEKLARQLPSMDVDAYTRAFERCIEEMVPDTSWWEVTDCNIFNVLFTTHDVYGTIDCIIDSLKPEYKDIIESVDKDDEYYVGDEETGRIYYGKASALKAFNDLKADGIDAVMNKVEDDSIHELKEKYDKPEVLGMGYAAPTSREFVKEVRVKLKYNAFEDLEDLQKYMNNTIEDVEEFDAYWQAHKKAIMKDIKEAQDLIPSKYRK